MIEGLLVEIKVRKEDSFKCFSKIWNSFSLEEQANMLNGKLPSGLEVESVEFDNCSFADPLNYSFLDSIFEDKSTKIF